MENQLSNMSPMVYNDLSSLNTLKTQSRLNPDQAIKGVAQQFESLFMSMMLKSMRDTLPEDSLFGSSSMQTYTEMFDQQLALDMSRSGGVGLASLIERQLGLRESMDAESAAEIETTLPYGGIM